MLRRIEPEPYDRLTDTFEIDLLSWYRETSKNRAIFTNEDAEYGAEYALYVEETMKVLHPIGYKPDFVTADWRYSDAVHAFAFDADFVTYRRFLLIDADRIEEE